MKKLLLAVSLLGTGIASQAVTPDKVFENPYYKDNMFVKLPSEVSYNDERPVLMRPNYTLHDSYYTIDIVDGKLNVLKTLTVNKIPFEQQTVISGPALRYVWNYPTLTYQVVNTLADALQLVNAYYPNGYKQLDAHGYIYFFKGNTPIPEELATLGYPEEYLHFHPIYDAYARFRPDDHIIDFYEKGDSYCTGEPTDEIIVYGHETTTQYLGSEDYLDYYNLDDYSEEWELFATQTLFNNDADYEVLLPKISGTTKISDSESMRVEYTMANGDTNFTWIDVKKEYDSPVYAGYEVRSIESGALVTTLEFPAGYDITNSYLHQLVVIDNNRYVTIRIYTKDQESYILFYELGQSSGIQSPVMIREVSVAPTMVNRGEAINVELGNDGEISGISVIGINGALEQTLPVRGNHAAISTESLSRGVHIVNVNTTDGRHHNRKIIVK